jgi:hypothetical protein
MLGVHTSSKASCTANVSQTVDSVHNAGITVINLHRIIANQRPISVPVESSCFCYPCFLTLLAFCRSGVFLSLSASLRCDSKPIPNRDLLCSPALLDSASAFNSFKWNQSPNVTAALRSVAIRVLPTCQGFQMCGVASPRNLMKP